MRTLLTILSALAVSVVAVAAPVKIGAVYCSAGPQKALDEPSWRGAQAAVALRNRSGGLQGAPVQLIRVAADSTAESVAASVRAALAKDPDIAAFVGLSDTGLALAAGREAKRAGKVFVTSGATSPLLPSQVGAQFFLACFGDNVQAAAAAEWLRTDKGAKSVCVLYDNDRIYTRLLQRYFADAFQAAGGRVSEKIGFRTGEAVGLPRDPASCDAIFVAAASPAEAARVVGKLRAAGYGGVIVGGDGFDGSDVWIGNPDAKNVFFTTHAFPARGEGAAGAGTLSVFRSAYSGGMPDAFSGLGFDATRLLMRALEGGAGPDLARRIQKGASFAGVTGPIVYRGGSRVPVKPVAIVAADSARTTVKQVSPSAVPAP